jgi:aminopeptidase N
MGGIFKGGLHFLLGAAALAAGLPAATAAPETTPPAAAQRRIVLPSAVTPDHYRIEVTPDAKALTFTGKVRIDVTVHQPTDKIVLNAADLVIDSASLSGEGAAPKISYDEDEQTASFAFGHVLKPGAYTLSLAYHGKIYQQASGFFALDYVSNGGGQARALFTQFENSDARRFVPSWDEPGRKATFELTAVVPADQMPVSNMPVAATETLTGGLKRVRFAETPKMSSYLLFFGLGDFERVHRMVDGVDVGVIVKRGDGARAAYALDAEAEILPYYNRYFATPFPLPKLDLIAGPGSSQFFGAMENWGAIFSFEGDLLIDPRISTEGDKQNVYIVTAHEMAHQWFGDLVTMAWWDDLWLNEGFASWMENKVTDHFHPEWKVWLQGLQSKQGAMQVDARGGTHPIITPIYDVLQASGAFDTITYSKGQAVIRMLEAYVGEDAWRDGVRRYMHDHAYGNTTTDDLWAEMDKGSAPPITQMAHDFTLQSGVPMISLAATCAGERASGQLTLTQGRFAIDPAPAETWRTPVRIADVSGSSLMPPPQAVVVADGALTVKRACATPLINAGQTGYFRSRYAPNTLAAITERYPALSAEDQLGLYNDVATEAYVGEEPMGAFLALTDTFKGFAADPVVMTAVAGRLAGLDDIYKGLPTQAAYRAYARGVLAPTYARLGWTKKAGESDNTNLLRSRIIATLGDLGDPAVVAEARRRFSGFLADRTSLDPTTRITVLAIVAANADPATWDQLHALAKSAKTQIERQQYYGLLGAAEDKALAQRALDLALSGEPEPTTAPGIIGAVSGAHPEMAFDFAVAHWDQISKLLEPSTQAGYIPRLLANASDARLIAKLDAFAAEHIPAGARQDVLKTDSTIRYVSRIRTERLPEVDRWIAEHGR